MRKVYQIRLNQIKWVLPRNLFLICPRFISLLSKRRSLRFILSDKIFRYVQEIIIVIATVIVIMIKSVIAEEATCIDSSIRSLALKYCVIAIIVIVDY